MGEMKNNAIDLIYYIAGIYRNHSCVEEITLKKYPNNILNLYIKVKDYYINNLGYLINDGLLEKEEILIDKLTKEINTHKNKEKLVLSSNIYSQKRFGTFNNTYNNIEPISTKYLYMANKQKIKIKK